MRVLYFDCFSGISGDMTLGALIDCGVDCEKFKRELAKLNIDGYEIDITRGMKNGISGTDVNVILEVDHDGNDHHDNDGNDEHNHEDHHHEHGMHSHAHRNLSDIEKIIDDSSLSVKVKELSKLMFKKVAVSEAKIHGKSMEEIHFHEVGAVDSIIDIVGTAICIEELKIDKFVSSPVNTGMGFVKCQHGIIPVPGPAALEMLKGVPVYSMDINTELVTPTGAAIISTLCSEFGPLPRMVVERCGYGCGKKDIEIPNLLRVVIGEDKKKDDYLTMMECNIDDMNSEFYDYTMEKLFKDGALDVFMTNIIMKKSRPAVKLSVLCRNEDVDKLSGIIFANTSSIGIRRYPVERESLDRKMTEVITKYGPVRVKIAYRNGTEVNYAPEYDDVKKAAMNSGVPVKTVYNEAIKNI